MLNTRMNPDMMILSASVKFSALSENIRKAFVNEFIYSDEVTKLTDNNTEVVVTMEHDTFDSTTKYHFEVTFYNDLDEIPDTVGKYIDLNPTEAEEIETMIKDCTIYALAHIND